ncbi:MAG: class I SAM-dependent methyltransferase [Deltaproteobacteria bacterium]|nr:class I SAM-dependent methyltransferase [Deltaproteobacteria bacterium]MBW2153065.1 class I SAM-dependent methyltransferase [Deltaproteobacteria bacterium]
MQTGQEKIDANLHLSTNSIRKDGGTQKPMITGSRIDDILDSLSGEELFTQWLQLLRQKWHVVPAHGKVRVDTITLAALSDSELLDTWISIRDAELTLERFQVRGWYHELYSPLMAASHILDVGAGIGLDGLTFAQKGARVTFMDIVPENLELIERIADLLQIEITTVLINDKESFALPERNYDVIWCQGSMINAPFQVARYECALLLRLLRPGGRWIELAYPKERWEKEGRLPSHEWGERTDGPGTPWIEWYDMDKMRKRFAPRPFQVVLHCNFHDDDFNWFDLRLP